MKFYVLCGKEYKYRYALRDIFQLTVSGKSEKTVIIRGFFQSGVLAIKNHLAK
jgi:hypothetical protein